MYVKLLHTDKKSTKKNKNRKNVLKALIDTGASKSLIASSFVYTKISTTRGTKFRTAAGDFSTYSKTKLNFQLPELSPTAVVNHEFHISKKKIGQYDIIIGRDLINSIGLDTSGHEKMTKWPQMTAEIPYKPVDATVEQSFYIAETESMKQDVDRMSRILDAKYSKADLYKIAKNVKTLNTEEQAQLEAVLSRNESLFDRTLGRWKDDPYKIKLKNGATPYHAKPFSVPHAYEKTLKLEIDRLVKIGVLKKVNRSEWASPSFIIPNKDRTVRFINDFRELNKRIQRTPFPIPKIMDMLMKMQGFKWATSLDLNMGYYHIELHPESKKLCTLVFPWRKYEMQCLPMGLCNSPDIFQEKMSNLFSDLEYVRTYIDDLLVITKGSLDDHLEKLEIVLNKLR